MIMKLTGTKNNLFVEAYVRPEDKIQAENICECVPSRKYPGTNICLNHGQYSVFKDVKFCKEGLRKVIFESHSRKQDGNVLRAVLITENNVDDVYEWADRMIEKRFVKGTHGEYFKGFVLQDGSLAEAGQYLIQSKSDNKLYSMSEGAYNSLIRGEGVA